MPGRLVVAKPARACAASGWAAVLGCAAASVLAWVTAGAAAAQSPSTAAAPDAAAPARPAPTARLAIPVRLFVDLQDEHSREALQRVDAALAADPSAAWELHLHHLPLGRHGGARAAAAAALAARRQGKELGFIRAVLRQPALHTPDLMRAADAAGLDRGRFEAERAGPALADELERERRTAIAFGVRATPSALVGGRGVVGVPPRAVLQAALAAAVSAWRRCADRGVRDCEHDVVRRSAPSALAGLAVLRGHLLGRQPKREAEVRGELGERWNVSLRGDEPALGAKSPEVIAVAFVDATDPSAPASVGALLRLAADRPWLRLVLLPMAEWEPGRGGAAPAAVEVAVALLAAMHGQDGAAVQALWQRLAASAAPADAEALGRALGWSAAEALARAKDSGATVLADAIVQLAITVDARPGTIFLQGRQWLGHALDAGLAAAADKVRAEMARQPRKGLAGYERAVQQGRRRDPAEIDLDSEEPLGDMGFLVDLGTAAPEAAKTVEVLVFVDFTQPASRAAFYALRLLRAHPKHPIRLKIASIGSSAEPGVTPAAAALLVSAARGRGLDAASALFESSDPYDWRVLRLIVRRFGIKPQQLGEGAASERVRAAMAAAARAAARLDMIEDPVIYVGRRRYLGPIEENRIVRAVAAEHDRQHRPPQEAP